MPNPTNIVSASFWPGLQNVGQTSGQAFITGTLNQSPSGVSASSSNMTGSIFISLPDSTVVSIFRVNFPDGTGDMASKWFPLFGTLEIWNTTNPYNYKLIMTIGSAAGGRIIYFNFVNAQSTSSTINLHMNIVGHLYSYPW